MAQPHSTMAVRLIDEKTSVIAVQGELTSFAEPTLMDAYLRACASTTDAHAGHRRSPQTIIFDFSQMEYMNSGGIGLLVTLLIRMHRQRLRMLAYGLSEHYQQIFAITRLDEAIGIYDTEADALAAAECV